jgi:ribosomal-protein-alanine N-acetyltransferase
MEYAVSLMTLADVNDVVEIEKQSFPIPWSTAAFVDELTRNERAVYIVIRDESGTMVGYGGMWLVCDEAHVTNIAVRSDRRRQGAGTAVMIGLMGLARSKGARLWRCASQTGRHRNSTADSGSDRLESGPATIWITGKTRSSCG